MQRFFLPCLLLLFSFQAKAQYTEAINSNRPGHSQGAFAVGPGVYQLEIGGHYGQNSHNLTGLDTDLYGIDYAFRIGAFAERLEFSLRGDYVHATRTFTKAGSSHSYEVSNFRTNVLGVKFLLYDPHITHMFDKPNLYSWKANHSFKLWKLIPAVSIYAGANLRFGDLPTGYPFYGDIIGNVTPTAAIITQHNWGRFVFVMNFIADRFLGDYPRYSGIFTLTNAVSSRVSVFAEYQTIKDDLYSDDLFSLGGAYLFTRNFQLDLSGTVNFKDTPSRWRVELGVSYRVDRHNTNKRIYEPKSKKELKDKSKKKKGDGKTINELPHQKQDKDKNRKKNL